MSQKKILLVEDNEFNWKIVRDLLARQPVSERARLLVPGVGEIRIGAAVDERKRGIGVCSFRRAVTDEDDLRRALRQRERPLLGRALLLRYFCAAQGSTSTLIDSFFRSWIEKASSILSSGSRCVIRGSTRATPALSRSTAS